MTASRNSPDESIVAGILAALDLAIFERMPDGLFHRVGPVPRWFEELLPAAAGADTLDLTDVFPYLETFFAELPEFAELPKAELPKKDALSNPSRSDTWRERDRQGNEIFLQALALSVDGNRV